MTIEDLQATIRETLKEFEIYEDQDEDFINVLSEKVFKELQNA